MRHLDTIIGATLLLAGLTLAGLFGLRLVALNRLEAFEGPVRGSADFGAFRGEVERCDDTPRRLTVAGWIARPGVARGRHATRVLLRDDADGRFWQLPTELPARIDVNTALARELGDGIDYTTSGFAASIDLRKAAPRILAGRVFVAYDDGGARPGAGYVLVPTSCVVAAR